MLPKCVTFGLNRSTIWRDTQFWLKASSVGIDIYICAGSCAFAFAFTLTLPLTLSRWYWARTHQSSIGKGACRAHAYSQLHGEDTSGNSTERSEVRCSSEMRTQRLQCGICIDICIRICIFALTFASEFEFAFEFRIDIRMSS